MSNFVKHLEIISSIPSKFAQAKSSGSLFFYPSTRVRVTENKLNFIISTCPALQQKPALPAPDFAQHDKPDPFAPPYVPDLFVGEIKDELDGDEYAILLNKFSVISGHFLMVTKGFQPQNSPLTPSDLSQAYLLIRAARKSPTPIFAFYNCGANSGASQPHKHIQFIPSSQNIGEDDEEEEDESSGPPAEAFVRTLKIEDDTKVFTLPLPYVHLAVRLDLPKPIQTGSKSLSAESLETLSNTLTHAFMRLLDEAVQTVRLYHDSQGSDLGPAGPGRASVPSYNVLLTGEHMHLIPRLREDTVDELKPEPGAEGEEVHEPQRLSINSLGFAGMLLAKSDAELRAIKVKGVVELLKQVGVPKVEEAAVEESAHS